MQQLVFDFAIQKGKGHCKSGLEIHPCANCGIPGRYQTANCTPCRIVLRRAAKRSHGDPMAEARTRWIAESRLWEAYLPDGRSALGRTAKGSLDKLHDHVRFHPVK